MVHSFLITGARMAVKAFGEASLEVFGLLHSADRKSFTNEQTGKQQEYFDCKIQILGETYKVRGTPEMEGMLKAYKGKNLLVVGKPGVAGNFVQVKEIETVTYVSSDGKKQQLWPVAAPAA
jgi:hypothetical protein